MRGYAFSFFYFVYILSSPHIQGLDTLSSMAALVPTSERRRTKRTARYDDVDPGLQLESSQNTVSIHSGQSNESSAWARSNAMNSPTPPLLPLSSSNSANSSLRNSSHMDDEHRYEIHQQVSGADCSDAEPDFMVCSNKNKSCTNANIETSTNTSWKPVQHNWRC